MDKRRSKKMGKLTKKIFKITVATFVIAIMYMVYCQNIMMDIVDQWIDQKYDYIQMNNGTENTTYSVDKMRKEIYNITVQPKEDKGYDETFSQDDEFQPKRNE